MNYLYIALALREAGREINEANMRKVLAALDVQADEAEMHFFTSALAILASPKGERAAEASLLQELRSLRERLEQLEGFVTAISDRLLERKPPLPSAEAPIERGIEAGAPAEAPHPGPLLKGEGAEAAPPGEAATGNDGRYIYGIADKGVAASLGPIGLEDSEVYTIPYKAVCAVVHNCPAQPYKSDDDEVVKGWVLTHQKVLDAAVERFDTVLPMGFDTIIHSDEADPKQVVKDWLKEDYEGLQEKMAKVRGRQEFGVQIMWDPKVIGHQIAETNEEIKALDEEMKSKPKGMAYMYKQKLEKLVEQKMEERADDCFKELYGRIKECVDDTVVEKTKKVGDDKQMLMNLSCLVHKDKVEALGEELEEIEGMEGFSVRFTGPWPPYSFVTPGKV